MKLTKELEAEILKTYHSYWDSYLNGDMDRFASALDDHCQIIGSTAFDIFHNKNDAVDFYTSTADQVAGKAQFRNRKIELIPFDRENIMVQEFCDFYFLHDEEWHFYASARMSTVLSKKEGGWKIVHQHGSMPDIKADEGEQVATEKVTKENIELREAVKRRTRELEQKNRELEIEAALEKVRSQSMAMYKSGDLQEVIKVVTDQLSLIGLKFDHAGFVKTFPDGSWDMWLATPDQPYPAKLHVPYLDHIIFNDVNDLVASGKDFFASAYSFEEKNSFFNHFFENTVARSVSGERKEYVMNSRGMTRSAFLMKDIWLNVSNYDGILYTEEENVILKRFAKVFEQSYVRFLDLQKAEEQAREAQIEAALERVRSSAMAMQNSEELNALIGTVFTELTKLHLVLTRCVIMIYDPETQDVRWWMANSEAPDHPMNFLVKYHEHLPALVYLNAWKERILKWVYILEGKIKQEWDDYLFTETELSLLPDFVKAGMRAPGRIFLNTSFYNFGGVTLATIEPLTEEHFDILIRFAKVFDLTYTRFNDLKQAEAQAREAQIETALERIRAKALSMQSSTDLFEVASVLRDQMGNLGQPELESSVIHLYNEEAEMIEAWYAYSPPGHSERELIIGVAHVKGSESEWATEVFSNYRSGKTEYLIVSTGKKLIEWYHILQKVAPDVVERDEFGNLIIPDILYYQFSRFSGGALLTISNEEPAAEARNLQKRASAVFEFAYKRFLDLQKAELQAKEAVIEAALEKVRGKAMAMHNSNDLSETAVLVFSELKKLGISTIRCGVGLLGRESRKTELYSVTAEEGKQHLALIGSINLEQNDTLTNIYDSWVRNDEYFPVLAGADLKAYYESVASGLSIPVPEITEHHKQYGHFLPFTDGSVYAWSDHSYSESEMRILKRFTAIIDLTFRRYTELKRSEQLAFETMRRASFDRIRAETASMRTIADLDRITPLIWNELNVLGVPFLRCGVFIMDDAQQLIHTFLSTPDGKAIASFHIPYNTPGNISQVISHWKENRNYIDHWDESDFLQFAETLMNQGVLDSPEKYLQSIPRGGFHLHFLPFLQGMLYVGNTELLNMEEIKLVQAIADAFSTAYARYEDFNRLESAKEQVDKTLSELKQAQTQLVQSAKMASLGELTAGIAHEIQNPLNFVNNFSEVSAELIAEVEGLLAGNDGQDTRQAGENKHQLVLLLTDIKQNLEKISHHGKRADGIVKGMLQHSRSSSGQKDSTDLNALADEYIKLAFHGYRGKDKSFNAHVNTSYDPEIGKIEIAGQEIGRVLLNIYNNAFYSVAERKRLESAKEFEPVVYVQTRKIGNNVEISVKDNGNGIPEKVLDKIFQPFFTTKPTGQGTGLGLSLSYDIVRAHGGEINVVNHPGNGAEFIITLPLHI